MTKFKVVRQHYGDKMYMPGEERELTDAEAKHLVPHVLEPIKEKAEPSPQNKAESAPANKADHGRKVDHKAKHGRKGDE